MKKALSLMFSLLFLFTMVIAAAGCSNTPPGVDQATAIPPASGANAGSSGNAAAENKPYRLAVIIDSQQLDFFAYLIAAANKRAQELGMQLDVFDGQGDFSKASDFFDQAVALGYDCILTTGDKSFIPAVLDANAAGVPVVNFDQKLPEGEFVARVSSDNYGMGVTLGEYAVEQLTKKYGEPKGVVMSLVNPNRATQVLRNDGFKSIINQYPNITYTEVLLESHLPEPTQRQVDDVLVRVQPGEVDLMFGANSGGALGGLASVVSAGRNEIAFIGIDDEEGQLMALQDPDNPYLVTMAQNPMLIGRTCVEVAYEYLTKGTIAGDVDVACTFVTKDTVDEYIESVRTEKDGLQTYMVK